MVKPLGAMNSISSHGTRSELSSPGLTLLERLRGSDPGSAADSKVGRSNASGSCRGSSPKKSKDIAMVPPSSQDASQLGSVGVPSAPSRRGSSDSSCTSSTFSEHRSASGPSVRQSILQPKQRPSCDSQGYLELFDQDSELAAARQPQGVRFFAVLAGLADEMTISGADSQFFGGRLAAPPETAFALIVAWHVGFVRHVVMRPDRKGSRIMLGHVLPHSGGTEWFGQGSAQPTRKKYPEIWNFYQKD
eukprot:s21_g37.t1